MAIEAPPAVEAVVVQPARLPPAAGDAAFSIVQVNRETLSAEPRLDEVLTAVPGASLFRRTSSVGANPTTQGISLRGVAGSGASRALVTLDGVPQNDPFGGWVIWTAIPSEIIDGARIVRGAGAGPYGAGALTGVISLDERTTVPGGFAGEVSIGQRDYMRGAAVVDGKVGSSHVLLSASTESSDGWIPVEPGRRGAADIPLSLDAINTSARVLTPLGDNVLAVRVAAYREKRSAGLVGASSRAEGWSGSVTLASAPADGELGYRLQAWTRESDLYNSSVSVAANRAATTPANIQYKTPATGYGFNAALRSQGANFTWELGGDVRITDGETREQFRFMAPSFRSLREAGGHAFVGGAYAEGTYTSGPWLITGGLRLDYWKSSEAKRLERDAVTGAVTLDSRPEDRSGTVPTGRIGTRLALNDDGLYWRNAAYAGFRPATLNELHRPFRVGNDVTEANAGLKPERLYGAETGFGGTIAGSGAWSISAFYNRLEDAIANVTIGAGPATFPVAGFIPAGGVLRQRQNAGVVEAWGIEADAERQLAPGVLLSVAANYTHAEVDGGTAAPQLTGLRPAQTPRFTALAGLVWTLFPPATVRLDVRYEGARFDDDLNSRTLASAVVFDTRVDWRVAGPLAVYAAIDNMFDANIETARTGDGVRSYAQPMTFRAGFTVRR
jgi:outer membrane receptor protein involved in Fe transport